MPTIEERIRQWQQELLDFSNRNTLLNFRPSTTRPTTIEIIGPSIGEIYDTLRQGRALAVIGNDPPETEADDDTIEEEEHLPPNSIGATDVEVEGESGPPSVRSGTVLARLPSERTNRVLLRLAARARAAELEQASTPSLPSSDCSSGRSPRIRQLAIRPLVMLPLRIEELTREDRFRIAASGDDPEFNLTLTERLRRDFGLDVSVEIDDETNLSTTLDIVREAVSRRTGWEVLDQVHIGHFQFFKLRTYKDLAEHASVAAGHDIIQALGSDLLTIAPLPDGIPTEEDLDRLVPPEQTFTILDADASRAAGRSSGNTRIASHHPGPSWHRQESDDWQHHRRVHRRRSDRPLCQREGRGHRCRPSSA